MLFEMRLGGNGYVSRDAAERIYGVVLTEDGGVDVEATAKLRSS
jgi:hypothetical protein